MTIKETNDCIYIMVPACNVCLRDAYVLNRGHEFLYSCEDLHLQIMSAIRKYEKDGKLIKIVFDVQKACEASHKVERLILLLPQTDSIEYYVISANQEVARFIKNKRLDKYIKMDL